MRKRTITQTLEYASPKQQKNPWIWTEYNLLWYIGSLKAPQNIVNEWSEYRGRVCSLVAM